MAVIAVVAVVAHHKHLHASSSGRSRVSRVAVPLLYSRTPTAMRRQSITCVTTAPSVSPSPPSPAPGVSLHSMGLSKRSTASCVSRAPFPCPLPGAPSPCLALPPPHQTHISRRNGQPLQHVVGSFVNEGLGARDTVDIQCPIMHLRRASRSFSCARLTEGPWKCRMDGSLGFRLNCHTTGMWAGYWLFNECEACGSIKQETAM